MLFLQPSTHPSTYFPSIPHCCIFKSLRKKKLVWLKNEYLEQRHKSKTIDYLLNTNKKWCVFPHLKKAFHYK